MSIGIMPYLTDLAAIRRLPTNGADLIDEIVLASVTISITRSRGSSGRCARS